MVNHFQHITDWGISTETVRPVTDTFYFDWPTISTVASPTLWGLLCSIIGEGKGNPLRYPCLENPMAREAWCRLQSVGSQRVGHNWMASLSFLFESGHYAWASLVVLGWRICLRIQGTWVPPEIREDPTCCRATKRVNKAIQPVLYNLLLFSCSVMSESLRHHGLQHAGFPVLHHLLRLVQTLVHEFMACAREAAALGSPPTTTWEQPPPATARQGWAQLCDDLIQPGEKKKKNNKKKIVTSHTPYASSPAWWGFHLHVS